MLQVGHRDGGRVFLGRVSVPGRELPGEEFAYPPSQAGLEAAQDHKGERSFSIVTIVTSHLVTDSREC